MRRGILLLSIAVLAALPSVAQENDDCQMCHEDPDLTGEVGGREVSVHVDPGKYAGSVHADLDCIACHLDLDGAELPHDEELERVDCSSCHDDVAEQHSGSLHGVALARGDELAPTCADCHRKHDILPHTDPRSPTSTMNIPLLCGTCHREGSPVSRTHEIHQDRILENYSLSIHGEGLFKQGLTVTAVCTSCHTSHRILPHTNPDSSIHRDNITETCTACHARIEQVHTQVIEGRLWLEAPGVIPACVDCHSPHKIRRVFYDAGMANKDCLKCHGKEAEDRSGLGAYVDEAVFNLSSHAGTACAQCHTGVTASRTHRPCRTIESKVDCGICHARPVQDYNRSTHGRLLIEEKDPDAPGCEDCHDDAHATMDMHNPVSPTFPRNVPELCGRCHREGEAVASRIESDIPDIVGSYNMSIHGKGLLQSGLVVTATCTNCHGPHMVLGSSDEESNVHPSNVSDTCGTCHHGIEETFKTSIHWPDNSETDEELPTCEDCHSSHTISRTDLDNFRFRMMDQCGRCHEDETETYFDTFHGKVSRLGEAGAAKCYDCHGTHDIHPTSDARSWLSRENVVQTCGQEGCHPGAHRRFAGYLTHATHHDRDKYPYLFATFWAMTALLVGTLTFALAHTFAWLIRLWLSRKEWKHHKIEPGEKLYRRFSKSQRTNHLVMLISFFVLAITGMVLKFSYSGWAQWLAEVLGGFDTTGVLHRIAAIVLFVVFFMHLMDIRRKRIRRSLTWKQTLFGPDSMTFGRRDVVDFVASMKWFFGLGPRPRYGRYTYWEKFDYFAVFWGIAIIGSTGLVLWFPELFTRILPGWSVNVATIIHSDEALLAVGFIFTVHFFNTHFRPDKFPMDPVIFTGRVPLEELKHDKPDEYEKMASTGELRKRLVDPLPRTVERGFRIFGMIALAVGLTLIALIVYAMTFGYR